MFWLYFYKRDEVRKKYKTVEIVESRVKIFCTTLNYNMSSHHSLKQQIDMS